jgi:hypothetical protein
MKWELNSKELAAGKTKGEKEKIRQSTLHKFT